MKFCPNCGTKIEDQKTGCPNCGFKTFEYVLEVKKNDKSSNVVDADMKKSDQKIIDENAVQAVKGKHEKYDYYENRSYDTYNYDSYDYMNSEASVDTKDEPSLSSKIFLIAIVVFLNVIGAIIGLIVGGVFVYKKAGGYKSYGKKLIIASAVFLVLDIFCWWMIFMALGNIL